VLLVKLSNAEVGHLPGWIITREVKLREAYEVAEKEITYITAKRTDPPWPAGAAGRGHIHYPDFRRLSRAKTDRPEKIILRRPTS